MKLKSSTMWSATLLLGALLSAGVSAQLRDVKEKISGNTVNEGIQKNLPEQIGAGRGNVNTASWPKRQRPTGRARAQPRKRARSVWTRVWV